MRTVDLTKRDNKGAALTWPEMDANWREAERQLKGLALPKHTSLSSDDIGKLVILKNGQVKLPEFSPVAIGAQKNVAVSFTGVFAAFQRPLLTFTFTDNLIANDYVELTLRTELNSPLTQTFVAVEADDSTTEFIIGATKEDTMANFIAKLDAWMLSNNIHPAYSIDGTVADNVCRIIANAIDAERPTNFWETTSTNQLYITIDRNGDLLYNRVGTALTGALLLSGLKYNFDGAEIFMDDIDQALSYLTDDSNSIHTDVVYERFNSVQWRFPASRNELLEGVGEVMKTGPYPFGGFVDYERSGSTLTLKFSSLAADFSIDSPGDYGSYFSSLSVTDGEDDTILLCNYPVIGQLVGIHETNAIVSQDKLGQFTLKGDTAIAFDGEPSLSSLKRICILDSDHPGFVRCIDESPSVFLKLTSGYVMAMSEADPDETFIGCVQPDVSFISILLKSIGGE